MILREQPGDRKRRQPNPLYLGGGNSYGVNDPRKLQMVFVVRLDGPDLKTITRMVEDAIAIEKSGLKVLFLAMRKAWMELPDTAMGMRPFVRRWTGFPAPALSPSWT